MFFLVSPPSRTPFIFGKETKTFLVKKDLSLTLSLHPSFFGPNMRTYLKHKLLSDVEGTCSGQYGYIICVLDHQKIDIGAGKIIPGVGLAEFDVKYQAIIFKPFKGEVVDATVTTVNKVLSVLTGCEWARSNLCRWDSLRMWVL